MIERTLVLIKPDGVQRSLIGEVISRFEKAGLKVVGLKMKWVDEDFAKEHYFDVAERHGDKILKGLVQYLKEGPIVAMVLEGVEAVEVVRKMVGPTEPKSAPPGTIRGDYCHISYGYADKKEKAVINLIHASAKPEEAKKEIALWFSVDELHSYKNSLEKHVY